MFIASSMNAKGIFHRSRGAPVRACALLSLIKTYCRKALPPAATGWRPSPLLRRHWLAVGDSRASFAHPHTRSPGDFLDPSSRSQPLPQALQVVDHFSLRRWFAGRFSLTLTTHPASGRFSIARKAAMPSGCLRAIDLSTTNDTLVLYKGSWKTVILAASLDMTLPPIRPHSSKVVTGLPNPMMYNACTTQSSPATGWCNRPKVSSTTMCESLQACGPSTAVKACGPDYDLCIMHQNQRPINH